MSGCPPTCTPEQFYSFGLTPHLPTERTHPYDQQAEVCPELLWPWLPTKMAMPANISLSQCDKNGLSVHICG